MIQLVILSVFALVNFIAPSSSTNFYHKTIPINHAPYMAAIGSAGMYVGCGGIISRYHIITAAHICQDFHSNSVVVRVGSDYYIREGKEFQSSQLIYHPSYTKSAHDYDFLVIVLDKSLEYSRKIRPITLPDYRDKLYDRDMLYVTGWSETDNPVPSRAQLGEVRLPVINTKLCQRKYRYEITPRMICVGGNVNGRGPGLVDDGALAIHNTKLVGLASTVSEYDGVPTVFTSVSSVREWLRNIVDY